MDATKGGYRASLTTWSLAALAAGLGLGIFGFQTGSTWIPSVASAVEPLGLLWLNALQMTVVPLVITQMLAAIVSSEEESWLGRVGSHSLLVLGTMMVGAGVLSLLVTPILLQFFTVAPETVAAIGESVLIPEAALAAAEQAPASFSAWLTGLVPTNVFEAATGGQILPLLIFTVVFGLAVNALPVAQREPLAKLFRALADALMVLIRWILLATPVGVFALLIALGLGTGMNAAGLLGIYLIFTIIIRLFFTGALYPITALFGRTSIASFARAAAPAQMVGLSTRSSLASLPAQIEGGKTHLNFPESTSAFVLPLCVSIFRLSRPVGSCAKLLFLGHVFGLSIGPAQMATFLITVILLNFTAVGIPRSGSTFKTLPAYLAAGVPIEGYIVLSTLATLTDFFATLMNVTGHMSAATILSRSARTSRRSPVTELPGRARIAPGEA